MSIKVKTVFADVIKEEDAELKTGVPFWITPSTNERIRKIRAKLPGAKDYNTVFIKFCELAENELKRIGK